MIDLSKFNENQLLVLKLVAEFDCSDLVCCNCPFNNADLDCCSVMLSKAFYREERGTSDKD